MEPTLYGPSGRAILGPTVFTIGRASDNQLVITDLQVSAHHAEIRPEGQGYCILDRGSMNHTFINEHQLTPNIPRSLNPGDRIRFGKNAVYTYELNGLSQVARTVRADATVRGNSTEPHDQSAAPYSQRQRTQQVPPPPPQPASAPRQCHACGAGNRPNAPFCINCGTQLTSASRPQHQQAQLKGKKKFLPMNSQMKVALIGALATVIAAFITAGVFWPNPSTSTILKLNSSYTGSYSVVRIAPGINDPPGGPITFFSIAEDDQGQVQSEMALNSVDYKCQGSVNASRNLVLSCTRIDNVDLHVVVNGHVSQNGQLSGTLSASSSATPSFYEDATWSAQ